MKYLVWFIGIIVTVLLTVYIIAFTPFGNTLIKPIVEEKIKMQTKLDSKLNVFSLNMSDFEIVLELNSDNVITIVGNYSLFSKSFYMTYEVKLDELSTLKELSGVELSKSFLTTGSVKGDMAFIEIDGVSDVASSDTIYHVELIEFNPTSIIAKVKNLKLEELLDIGVQKPYASADVNLDINFKNIEAHSLDGDVLLRTKDGEINIKVMKNDFNITIPHTNFEMNLDAKLKDDDVDYSYKFISNLFKISSSGKIIPSPLKTDIKYNLDVKELAVLKPMTGADVRGALRINGSIKGDEVKLVVDGKSDFASSDTRFEAIFKEFAPASINATIKNLKLAKALYMLKQPHYTDGILSLDADISDVRSGNLKGRVVTSVKNGLLNSKYMTKAYGFKTKMPRTIFNMSAVSTLSGEMIDSKLNFNSNLADFDITKARLNLKESSLLSDYKVKVHNLDKFFFVTERHMKGSIIANGELKKSSDLTLTIESKVAGGKIDALLHNDDFHADIVSVQTLDALHMLIYPEVFKSSLDAKLDYNLASEQGVLSGHLTDGIFTKNQIFKLLKKHAKLNLYREKFNGNINAKINKENVLVSLDLKSRKSSIKTLNTQLNTKTKIVDSKIAVVADKEPLGFTLKGKISNPKVSIDMKKLMKTKVGKKVKKEVKKLLKSFL